MPYLTNPQMLLERNKTLCDLLDCGCYSLGWRILTANPTKQLAELLFVPKIFELFCIDSYKLHSIKHGICTLLYLLNHSINQFCLLLSSSKVGNRGR